jgi:hypothetical protein
MDHDYIEQFNIVDRYLMGKLIVEESERFEEHFIDCPQCTDRLQTIRTFRQGLRQVALQEALQEKSHIAQEPQWFFLQWFSRKTWALATCGSLFVAILISIFAFSEIRRLRHERAQTGKAASELQRLYEEQQQSASSTEQQHQEREQSLKEQVQQLGEQLLAVQKQSVNPAKGGRDWTQPDINLLTVVLESVRTAEQKEIPEIKLSRTPMDFVISIPLEGESKYSNYQLTIYANQRRYWGSTGSKPDAYNSLVTRFNSSFFLPGNYYLEVKGLPSQDDSAIIGNYPFRISIRNE